MAVLVGDAKASHYSMSCSGRWVNIPPGSVSVWWCRHSGLHLAERADKNACTTANQIKTSPTDIAIPITAI
jgi:hypothetical protein